jgi:acetoacetyl-CoA synthetase
MTTLLENGERAEITWSQLRSQVSATAAAMRAEGVGVGDRIAAWVPNVLEAAIFGLAGLSIGAVVSTSSPDFAPPAVLDRFGQIEPVLLLAASSYTYGGKSFDCMSKLQEIVAGLPSLKKTIVIGSHDKEFTSWTDWITPFLGSAPHFEKLPFDHPGFVLFSSGTTGKPKCIVHRAAGILLKLRVEQKYSFDIHEGDKLFFFTTCGWMMWNWLLYILGSGASIVLYDGNPMSPRAERLIDIAESEKITMLGLSAKYIDSIRKAGISPKKTHHLDSLRTIMSTGSVLVPESFDYVYDEIKSDIHLASMSGGTDICGCFIAGIPTQPVYRGEIQGPCLGTAAQVFDEHGKPALPNAKGELVCTVPFPSMPLGFWGDTDGSKYRAAYFEGFPNVWTHGDFASRSEVGGFTMYGRSDATLNSKGVRIGTAEIYRVVETFPEIAEAMAVAQDWDNDSRVILFVTLTAGSEISSELESSIKQALKTQASPRHVPDLIIVAPELPRTKSNKLVELAVTDVINGRTVRNKDALANAHALDWFASLDLKSK